MVISFEEKDRAEIEATGVTVIEFKRRLYKMGKTMDDAWNVLKKCINKIANALSTAAEMFVEVIDKVHMVTEVIRDACHYPTSRRYKIAKVFSKCTGTNISFGWHITWKIKRWLARSCCV